MFPWEIIEEKPKEERLPLYLPLPPQEYRPKEEEEEKKEERVIIIDL